MLNESPMIRRALPVGLRPWRGARRDQRRGRLRCADVHNASRVGRRLQTRTVIAANMQRIAELVERQWLPVELDIRALAFADLA